MTKVNFAVFAIAAGLLAGACDDQVGPCVPNVRHIYAPDALTPFGLSGEQALASLATQTNGTLTWQNGSTSEFVLQIQISLQRSTTYPLGPPGCLGTLEIPVNVEVSTGDGLLTESTEGYVRMTQAGTANMLAYIPFEAIQGTVDLTAYYDVDVPDRVSLDVDLTETASSGRLRLHLPNGDTTVAVW